MFVLGFLKVWPSHPHLLLRISISILAWCVLSQRSLLLTLSIQCIRRILRRQWLTNVWILISVVLFIRHVSTPYSNTDFTFVLNKRIFVVSPITLDFHTFLNRWKATLALLILFFTSASVPPCVCWIPFHFSLVAVFMTQSMTRIKRNGDSKHPCLTPILTSKFFVS